MKMPDLNKAFPETPDFVHDRVLAGFEIAEKRKRLRRRIMSVSGIAAVLVIALIALSVIGPFSPAPDDTRIPLAQGSGVPQNGASQSPAATASPVPEISPTPTATASPSATEEPEVTPEPTPTAIPLDNRTVLPGDFNNIAQAQLLVGVQYYNLDGDGADLDARCRSLEDYLNSAALSKGTGCPFELSLNIYFEDGSRTQLTCASDTCAAFIIDDETYVISGTDNSGFLSLFGLNWEQVHEMLGIDKPTHIPTYTPAPSEGTMPEPTPTPIYAMDGVYPLPTAFQVLPGGFQNIASAQLFIDDQTYELISLDEGDSRRLLENYLNSAVISTDIADCPFYAILTIDFEDGTQTHVYPASDGCAAYIADGQGCIIPAEDNSDLLNLFGVTQINVTSSDSPTAVPDDLMVYCTPNGLYYHSTPDCGGMKNPSLVSVDQAIKQGQTACPYCMNGDIADNSVNSDKTAENDLMIYCTPNGTFYHSEPDCSGMMNASLVSIDQAVKEGKTACPYCMPGEASAVAADSSVSADSGNPFPRRNIAQPMIESIFASLNEGILETDAITSADESQAFRFAYRVLDLGLAEEDETYRRIAFNIRIANILDEAMPNLTFCMLPAGTAAEESIALDNVAWQSEGLYLDVGASIDFYFEIAFVPEENPFYSLSSITDMILCCAWNGGGEVIALTPENAPWPTDDNEKILTQEAVWTVK